MISAAALPSHTGINDLGQVVSSTVTANGENHPFVYSNGKMTVRSVPEWRSQYFHLAMRRGRRIAKVAMARRLAVRLFWMMRQGWDHEQVKKFGFARGTARTSPWYAVEHREIDGASRSSSRRSSK